MTPGWPRSLQSGTEQVQMLCDTAAVPDTGDMFGEQHFDRSIGPRAARENDTQRGLGVLRDHEQLQSGGILNANTILSAWSRCLRAYGGETSEA